MRITFYGAAGNVTGSKHLLDTDQARVLLDCGTFQGRKQDVGNKNYTFPFPPTWIDAVILSHAHIDHCGMLPRLINGGFTGRIHSTIATKNVARVMLADAAKIEEQDAFYQAKHGLAVEEPLFLKADIPKTIDQFQPSPYARHKNQWTQVTKNIAVKFYDAGHIIGSAVSVLKISSPNNKETYLAYTGDLGPDQVPLLHDPEIPTEPIETLIMESTYGSRQHEPFDNSLDRLASTIKKIYDQKGKIIVPAFSLGRTQMLVYLLHKLTDQGKIPRFPIYVDSPLATDVTEVFHDDMKNYDAETWQDFSFEDAPLTFRNLTYTRSVQESKALNNKPGPFLILSASGMMTAGRVVHHLRNCISDPNNAIFITGFQAFGTRGRKILDGAKEVKLHGDTFPVRAAIHLFNEFSAHADSRQLQAYAEKLPHLKQVALVHGEPHHSNDLAQQLTRSHPNWQVTTPTEGDSIEI